jgi:adenylate cyclase
MWKYILSPMGCKPPAPARQVTAPDVSFPRPLPTAHQTPPMSDSLPREIERKWLLAALPPHAHSVDPAEFAQGYLAGEQLIERIRRDTRAGVTRWLRTVKLGRGIARIEVEEETSPELGAALFALTAGRRVTKRRYAVTEGPVTWEIDAFTDRELFLAELELPEESAKFEIPDWLAPFIVREVTDDAEFTNWRLAR